MTLPPPPPGQFRSGGEDIPSYTFLLRDLKGARQRPAVAFAPADEFSRSCITAVIFTSSIPSNPSDSIIEKTYASINHQGLPNVLVLADGQSQSSYTEYKRRMRSRGWYVQEFDKPAHQTLMLRYAIDNLIKTPLVMVCEHDWVLRPDFIDWKAITKILLENDPVKVIQLRQQEPGDWELKFFGDFEYRPGINLLRTKLFQAPVHLASVEWYRKIVTHFHSPEFLERSEMDNALRATGGINEMACYIPDGGTSRLFHLDGRNATSGCV